MRKRDNRLDLLRVISMIMVVIIYIANYYCRAFNDIDKISYLGALIFNTISRTSVPFFFMISGATLLNKEYDKQKNKDRIIRKFITLFVITIIYFIWDKYYMCKGINIISLLSKPERKLLWFMYAACPPNSTCNAMLKYNKAIGGTYDYDVMKIIKNSVIADEITFTNENLPEYEIYPANQEKVYHLITDKNNEYLDEFLKQIDVNLKQCAEADSK